MQETSSREKDDYSVNHHPIAWWSMWGNLCLCTEWPGKEKGIKEIVMVMSISVKEDCIQSLCTKGGETSQRKSQGLFEMLWRKVYFKRGYVRHCLFKRFQGSVKWSIEQKYKRLDRMMEPLFLSSAFPFPYPENTDGIPSVCVFRPGLGIECTCCGSRNSNAPLTCTHS